MCLGVSLPLNWKKDGYFYCTAAYSYGNYIPSNHIKHRNNFKSTSSKNFGFKTLVESYWSG